LAEVEAKGRAQIELEKETEARRRGKEEIIPKAKILAESIPTHAGFVQRLKEEVGEITERHTKEAVDRIVRNNYEPDLARQEREREAKLRQGHQYHETVDALRHVKAASDYLAHLQREGPSFRTLAAALKPLVELAKEYPPTSDRAAVTRLKSSMRWL
jgi:hypothetical protein